MTRTAIGLLLAKVESSYATDPTPTGGANTVPVAGPVTWTLDADLNQRDILDGSYDMVSGKVGLPRVQIQFSIELRGNRTNGSTNDISNGTSAEAIEIDALLKACDLTPTYVAASPPDSGRNGSVSYRPTVPADDGTSVTFYFYSEKKKHIVLGAKGTFKLRIVPGKFAVLEFTFQGLHGGISDASIPTPTFLATVPPLVSGTGTTFSPAIVTRRLELDLGNQVTRREDIGATDGVGTKGFFITKRETIFTAEVEDIAEATSPLFQDFLDATLKTYTWVIGSDTGNIMQGLISGQRRNLRYGDANGGRIVTIEHHLSRTIDPTAICFSMIWK